MHHCSGIPTKTDISTTNPSRRKGRAAVPVQRCNDAETAASSAQIVIAIAITIIIAATILPSTDSDLFTRDGPELREKMTF